MEKWSNKIAVITGASSGIGAAIAKDLLINNLTVINVDLKCLKINPENPNFFQRKCDLTDFDALTATFKWIEETFGHIHILVNCAGVCDTTSLLDSDTSAVEAANRTIDVNLRALVHSTRESVRLMKKSGDYGMIINIDSILGQTIPFLRSPLGMYIPTKHAVRAFSEVIRQELIISDNEKIRITNICPGVVQTNLFQGTDGEFEKTFGKNLKILMPENISQSIIFLLQTPYNVNVSELTIKPVGEKM